MSYHLDVICIIFGFFIFKKSEETSLQKSAQIVISFDAKSTYFSHLYNFIIKLKLSSNAFALMYIFFKHILPLFVQVFMQCNNTLSHSVFKEFDILACRIRSWSIFGVFFQRKVCIQCKFSSMHLQETLRRALNKYY